MLFVNVQLASYCVFLGSVFGSKDQFHGLGVYLDTYSNHNGPHNVSKSNFLILLKFNTFF